MKKKIVSSLVLVALAGSIVTGYSASVNAKEAANQAIKPKKNGVETTVKAEDEATKNNEKITNISEQKAKDIALNHANVKEADITNLKISLDTEDGVTVYEVDFNVGAKEYDYDIHAANGNIISVDVDHEDDKDDNNSSNGSVSTKVISEDEAKKIVLTHAGVKESDIKNFTIELDNDDETPEYDIEFHSSNKEYDYTINAQTGSILESEVDVDDQDDDDDDISSNEDALSNIISEDKAKNIALAKVPGAMNSHIRIHLEKEDGKYVYEGTIEYENTEYDFEIDAQSGKVNEWDSEAVDED